MNIFVVSFIYRSWKITNSNFFYICASFIVSLFIEPNFENSSFLYLFEWRNSWNRFF